MSVKCNVYCVAFLEKVWKEDIKLYCLLRRVIFFIVVEDLFPSFRGYIPVLTKFQNLPFFICR
jgi:hypothetical protein